MGAIRSRVWTRIAHHSMRNLKIFIIALTLAVGSHIPEADFSEVLSSATMGSKVEAFGKESAKTSTEPSYKQYTNTCAGEDNSDLPQTASADLKGDYSLDRCKKLCSDNPQCSAVEWYSGHGFNSLSKCANPSNPRNCYLMLGRIPTAKGRKGPRYCGAICYVKEKRGGAAPECSPETEQCTCPKCCAKYLSLSVQSCKGCIKQMCPGTPLTPSYTKPCEDCANSCTGSQEKLKMEHGSICAPKCASKSLTPCPAVSFAKDVSFKTAAKCNFRNPATSSSVCVINCDLSSPADGQCPKSSFCHAVPYSLNGICVYHPPPPPPGNMPCGPYTNSQSMNKNCAPGTICTNGGFGKKSQTYCCAKGQYDKFNQPNMPHDCSNLRCVKQQRCPTS